MSKYLLIVNKCQQPPIEESEMVEGYLSGKYPEGTLVWSDGMADWATIETLPVIKNATPAPEPAPAPEPCPTPEPGPKPEPAPQAQEKPGTSGRVSEKISSIRNDTETFFKEKKWKDFTRKQWSVVCGAVIGGVAVGFGLLYCLLPASYDSDSDIKDYLEHKVKQVRKYDRASAVQIKKKIGNMKRSLREDGGQSGKRELVTCLGGWGETSALEYLFEEKEFDAELADIALVSAAHAGQTSTLKFLVKNDYCSGDEDVFERAYTVACQFGRLKACKYLVEDCEVRVKDEHLRRLLTITENEYKDMAKDLSAFLCDETKSDRIMKDVAEVAGYLRKQGARLDTNDSSVKSALQNCPNPHLKELFQ